MTLLRRRRGCHLSVIDWDGFPRRSNDPSICEAIHEAMNPVSTTRARLPRKDIAASFGMQLGALGTFRMSLYRPIVIQLSAQKGACLRCSNTAPSTITPLLSDTQ
jgi:hypothetical protein